MTSPIEPAVQAALAGAQWLAGATRLERAGLLRALADALVARGDRVVDLCTAETHLPRPAIAAELDRTVGQLRFFAEVTIEGSFTELTEDTSTERTARMHRWMVPLGVVGVFGPSNFPLAYGVLGTDAASAIAAGCAVVVKAHPSHPRTARELWGLAQVTCAASGAPAGLIGLVEGFEAGAALVEDARVDAVGFVGSVGGGRALFDRCAARPRPIPFYGELGSLNTVVVTPGAIRRNAADVAATIGDAMLARHGQMCTKPGLVLAPASDDEFVACLAERVDGTGPVRLLDEATRRRFRDVLSSQAGSATVRVRAGGPDATGDDVRPTLLEIAAHDFLTGPDVLRDECFGPAALVVRYADDAERDAVLDAVPAALVAGLHADADTERDLAERLIARLTRIAGRVVWDGPTTGLRVGWASHHGGGYPASTASSQTAVGAAALRRWLRPVSVQGLPNDLLPAPVLDRAIPRRVDGRLYEGVVP